MSRVIIYLNPLLSILMEALWIYPWLHWVGRWPALSWQQPPLSLASLVILMTLSFFTTRFLLNRGWRMRWVQLASVLVGLLAIFVVIRIEYDAGYGIWSGQWFSYITHALLDGLEKLNPLIIALPVIVYVWWRGTNWGRSPINFRKIYHAFLVGLIALVVLVVVGGLSYGAGVVENLLTAAGLYIAGFFFCGLTALALANRPPVHQMAPNIGKAKQVFNTQWAYILFVVVGGISLVGIGLAGLFSVDVMALLARWLSRAADLLLQGLYYILIPVGFIAQCLLWLARFLLNLLRGTEEPLSLELPGMFGEKQPQEVIPRALPPEVILILKWGFFAIVTALVIFLLFRMIFRRWPSRARDNIEESRESLWSWTMFKADLLLFLRMLWDKFRHRRKQPVPAVAIPTWYDEEDIPDGLDIREIYQHLMWEAANSGVARRRYQTAYEYAEQLGQVVPDGSQHLAQLTELYIGARYGALALPDKQITYANSLWRRLRYLLRGLRGAEGEEH